MKFIKSYESFKSKNKGGLNEEFIGGLLKSIIPDWVKNITVKNKRAIDRAFKEYKEEYEDISKDLSALLDSKDEIDKNKLMKIENALINKKQLIGKKLDNKLKELTKDNQKSKTYSSFKRNSLDLELINAELEQYRAADIESEYVDDLIKNTEEAEKKKKVAQQELKKAAAKESRQQSDEKIESLNDLTPGDILMYRNSNGDISIVKITDDGQIQRLSNTVSKEDFEKESQKADDKKEILKLFNKEETPGEPFKNPHKNEFNRLSRISKTAQEKFK
jgi:hypothetical protein